MNTTTTLSISLSFPLLFIACGGASTSSIAGRVDPVTLSWVSQVDAVGEAEDDTFSSALDDHGAFRLDVHSGGRYRLRLTDAFSSRIEFVHFETEDHLAMSAHGGEIRIRSIHARHGEPEAELEVEHGVEVEFEHGTEVEHEHGTEVEREHGTEVEHEHGTEVEREHGTEVEREHGTEVEQNR